jgi:hypothetical protein
VLLLDDAGQELQDSGSSGLSADYVLDVNERRTITLTSGPLSGAPSSRAFPDGDGEADRGHPHRPVVRALGRACE